MLILSSAIQNVGVQLLIATSCEACLVLRLLPALFATPAFCHPVPWILSVPPVCRSALGASGQMEPGFFSTLTILPARSDVASGDFYPSGRMDVVSSPIAPLCCFPPVRTWLLADRGPRFSLWKSFMPGTSVGLRLTKPICPFYSNCKCKCCRCSSAATFFCC